jgi:hypothetical protein
MCTGGIGNLAMDSAGGPPAPPAAPKPRPQRPAAKKKPVVISSDEEDDDECISLRCASAVLISDLIKNPDGFGCLWTNHVGATDVHVFLHGLPAAPAAIALMHVSKLVVDPAADGVGVFGIWSLATLQSCIHPAVHPAVTARRTSASRRTTATLMKSTPRPPPGPRYAVSCCSAGAVTTFGGTAPCAA